MSRSTHSVRARAAACLTGLTVTAAVSVAFAPAAHAAPAVLTIVGTSDVFDSHLVQDVIEPGFEAAHPEYDLQYVSRGTGAAIAFAKAGSADGLIVHAASLENQFVGDGFSAESYGRALFWGDYVLLGPQDDPVGVSNGNEPSHDVATAFEKVAVAGANGTANFVSRGGTPGTTVQEHAIWDLTTDIPTCTVSDTNGGGKSPSTTAGACPDQISYPSWYHATGLTQGPNITNADTCDYNGGNCYVLTDRGTFNYLQSTNAISNLKIVARDNDEGSRGGQPLLVNSFHGYAVNPDAFTDPDVKAGIDEAGAVTFLNYVTSPAGQTAVGNYLATTQDPPFLPSAAPQVTASAPAKTVEAGSPITISGTVRNVVPGTPPLASKPVSLYGTTLATGTTYRIATVNTNSSGGYSFSYEPNANRTYSVRVGAITQIENSQLDPQFGDLLAPASAASGGNKVIARISQTGASTTRAGHLTIAGRVAPAAGPKTHVSLYLTRSATAAPTYHGVLTNLVPGRQSFSGSVALPKGRYRYYLLYYSSFGCWLGWFNGSV